MTDREVIQYYTLLCEKLEKYLDVLFEDVGSAIAIAKVHGWESKNYEEQGRLIEEINKIRALIPRDWPDTKPDTAEEKEG